MQNETKESVIYYSVALLIDPSDPSLHLYAAKALIDLNRFEEARGALVKAEELAPKEDLDFHSDRRHFSIGQSGAHENEPCDHKGDGCCP